jgi:hypothetical protein
MAWLPIYAAEADLPALLAYLNASGEIAFLVSNGPGRWIAVETLASLADGRYCLWHIPSGALPLLGPSNNTPGEVENPFAGWSEARAGADSTQPYFGAGHPGVLWLNIRTRQTHAVPGKSIVGLSSFEWIGNRYMMIGSPAKAETEQFWKALGRWVKEAATKVPRGGPGQGTPPEIWAFPGAQQMFQAGASGGND